MNTPDSPDNIPQSDKADKLAQLLANAGPRRAPPKQVEAEVRAAVYAEWQHLTQGRKVRQQRRWLSAAAVLMGVLSVGWLTRNMTGNEAGDASGVAPMLASVTEIRGEVLLNDATVAPAGQIHDGDTLRTADNAGMRIELNSGISVRVAANSEVQWLGADSVRLTRGAMYVDSHANAAPLTIRTVRGDVSHLGTRYLVDTDTQSLRVAVREGQVAIQAEPARVTVDSLQQVELGADGNVVRSDLQITDSMWQWADALAQPFVVENHSLAEFLQWVASETGCELSYASPAVQAAASSTVLHGEPSTRAPLQALRAVLAATDFQAAIAGRQLVVSQAH